jgi:hypothetical protein
VFFRIAGLSDDREAFGAQGLPLTPGRSIAVDILQGREVEQGRTTEVGKCFSLGTVLRTHRRTPSTRIRFSQACQRRGMDRLKIYIDLLRVDEAVTKGEPNARPHG